MKTITLFFLMFVSSSIYCQVAVEIGPLTTGTIAVSSNAPVHAVPYNNNSSSVHIQFIYTAAEMLAGGAVGASNIDSIGWYVMSQIGTPLLNYKIQMKNTLATNVLNYDGANLNVVYNHNLAAANDTGWYMIPFDQAFAWNGTSNILIDVCWGVNAATSATGTIKHFNTSANADERNFMKSNTASVCGTPTTSPQLFKPFVKFNTCASYSTVNNQVICSGQSYFFNGQNLTQSGIYRDTLQAVNGCDSILVLNLTVQFVNTSIGSSAGSLNVTATNSTIQWVNCNLGFTLINGATSSSYSPSVSGSYAAIITTQNGCVDTTICLNVTALGIASQSENQLAVFPNPADNELNIVIPINKQNLNYFITDVSGNVIVQGVYEKSAKIDISKLKTGLYFLQMENQLVKFAKK